MPLRFYREIEEMVQIGEDLEMFSKVLPTKRNWRFKPLKKLILFLLCSLAAFSQATTVVATGPVSARAGDTITVALSATGASTTGATAFQWSFVPSASGYTLTPTIGAAGLAAVKNILCTTDSTFCLLVGSTTLNNTVIPNGVLANYTIKVPTNAVIGGPVTFPLTTLAITTTGSIQPTVVGTTYSLNILDRRDITRNGVVDGADVNAMLIEIIAARANPAACVDDQNGDGTCDLTDAILVLFKALNLVP